LHIAFLNPQGNFDFKDSYWTEHPDFGGQLVYVKEVAIAIAALGHQVDILTRRVIDSEWPEFEAPLDRYPGVEHVRILRLPCGPSAFLPKEELWPHLGSEWVPNILAFYQGEGKVPDAFTAHYADGGLSGALLKKEAGVPFTFTGHSLGAQKMDKLGVTPENLADMDTRFHFARRIFAERVSMNHAGRIITSTTQERLEQYAHPAYHSAVDPSDGAHFAVIPPGVNRHVFSPAPASEDALVQHRIQAALERDIADGRRELPMAVASSRLDTKKNHLGLVQAFAHSQDLQASANLAIVVRGLDDPLRRYEILSPGEKAIMDEITDLMTSHDLWGKVTAFPLNSQPELAAAYRYLAEFRSVFALTALYEPFGLAPLEAMSCGLPAVVTKNGGPSESLKEGEREYGVLVNPSDPDDIAQGLLRVLGSEGSWTRFQGAGMQRVLSRYTWERTAEGYLSILGEMIREPARPGELAIPEYFGHPTPDNDIPPADLGALYFKETEGEPNV
jgi:sucrose-phosphate synthase